jgi:hypothetical protein
VNNGVGLVLVDGWMLRTCLLTSGGVLDGQVELSGVAHTEALKDVS